MVGRLIESLDRLGVTLNITTVAQTTQELLSTADGLNALTPTFFTTRAASISSRFVIVGPHPHGAGHVTEPHG